MNIQKTGKCLGGTRAISAGLQKDKRTAHLQIKDHFLSATPKSEHKENSFLFTVLCSIIFEFLRGPKELQIDMTARDKFQDFFETNFLFLKDTYKTTYDSL